MAISETLESDAWARNAKQDMAESSFKGRSTLIIGFIAFFLLNWNPVISVPTGLADKNMPIGMEIITQTYDDVAAMQIAAAYAAAAPALYTGTGFPDFRDQL